MKFSLQKTLIVSLVVLTIGSFLPSLRYHKGSSAVSRAAGSETGAGESQAPAEALPTLAAVENYLNRLISAGCPSSAQAVLIQTLDGKVLVDHNADTPLNPASVMKLSTSYLALKHFGPDYRFKT